MQNPFSSCFIRPGELEYALFHGEQWGELKDRFLVKQRRKGAIVGPHGTGKTTFLYTFLPFFGPVDWYENGIKILHSASKCEPATYSVTAYLGDSSAHRNSILAESDDWNSRTLLALDGYEQWSLWARLRLRWRIARTGRAILVTSHTSVPFYPTLWTTQLSQQSVEYVVRRLLRREPKEADEILSHPRFAELSSRHGSNLREVLFDLYDWMEEKHGRAHAGGDRST